ncbi:MAG TPA: hypothetical protein VM143_01770 [Acidimicrobiales bacterium]|nr:hypothetical protein [Acidimicrobiales bacterium]
MTELTEGRRRALLREAFAAGRSFREIDAELSEAGGTDGTERLRMLLEHYRETITVLLNEYRQGVTRVELTRCPFTTQAVSFAIDTLGLDGFWWNYDGAVRPSETELPDTFFALSGAVRLDGLVRPAPFLAKPGPEAPYVLPRILEHPSMTAVLSSATIGEHPAYAIAYFAEPMPWDLPRVNSWGANHFWYVGADGGRGWDEEPLVEEDMDFDLAPWIAEGKLRWIAPEDATLELHEGLTRCPYLELPGRQLILRIEDGDVWTREEVS